MHAEYSIELLVNDQELKAALRRRERDGHLVSDEDVCYDLAEGPHTKAFKVDQSGRLLIRPQNM